MKKTISETKKLSKARSPKSITVASPNTVMGRIEIFSPTRVSGWIAASSVDLDDLMVSGASIRTAQVFDRTDVKEHLGTYATGFTLDLDQGIEMEKFLSTDLRYKEQRIDSPAPIFLMPQYNDWESQLKQNKQAIFQIVLSSCFFDAEYYRSQAELPRDVTPFDLLEHYLVSGADAKLDPHPLFSTKHYLKYNTDVALHGVNPLLHYVFSGHAENRTTSPDFDIQFYTAQYGQAIPLGVTPLQHYICHGYRQHALPVAWMDQSTVAHLTPSDGTLVSIPAEYRKKYANLPAPHAIIERAQLPRDIEAISANPGVDIIVPFYREPYLIKLCLEALIRLEEELRVHDCRVIAILDSPEDEDSVAAFQKYTSQLQNFVDVEAHINPINVGFVTSVNTGLRRAIARGRNALLLNSDCFMATGTLTEMLRVADADPMIGFVNPRSNNATIATFPKLITDIGQHFESFRTVCHLLPEVTYTPTCVGYCMLITRPVLANFGLLDITYGSGYNEENDYVSRANRVGFRASQANRAYAFHIGGTSFKHTDFSSDSNADILTERYPEYASQVRSYFAGRSYAVEQIIESFVPTTNNKLKLLFDISQIGGHPNGTSVMAVRLLREFASISQQFEIHVITTQAARRYNKLDDISGIHVHISWEELDHQKLVFAHAFRMGQPFKKADLKNIMRVSATTSFFMLDTIAYDCGYIADLELQRTWEAAASLADGFAYQSQFTRNQFERRFPDMGEVLNIVSYHSLDLEEYRSGSAIPLSKISFEGSPPGLKGVISGDFVLIVGNHFAHKDVLATYNKFTSAHPDTGVVIIGDAAMQKKGLTSHNAVFLKSGDIHDDVMSLIYRTASVVIFPSFYEGFGFPILESLANQRPLLLRDNSINREIVNAVHGSSVNEHAIFYRDYRDMISKYAELKLSIPPNATIKQHLPHDWKASASELLDFFCKAVQNWTLSKAYRRHLFLEERH